MITQDEANQKYNPGKKTWVPREFVQCDGCGCEIAEIRKSDHSDYPHWIALRTEDGRDLCRYRCTQFVERRPLSLAQRLTIRWTNERKYFAAAE